MSWITIVNTLKKKSKTLHMLNKNKIEFKFIPFICEVLTIYLFTKSSNCYYFILITQLLIKISFSHFSAIDSFVLWLIKYILGSASSSCPFVPKSTSIICISQLKTKEKKYMIQRAYIFIWICMRWIAEYAWPSDAWSAAYAYSWVMQLVCCCWS